jgi:hypothetical protein
MPNPARHCDQRVQSRRGRKRSCQLNLSMGGLDPPMESYKLGHAV